MESNVSNLQSRVRTVSDLEKQRLSSQRGSYSSNPFDQIQSDLALPHDVSISTLSNGNKNNTIVLNTSEPTHLSYSSGPSRHRVSLQQQHIEPILEHVVLNNSLPTNSILFPTQISNANANFNVRDVSSVSITEMNPFAQLDRDLPMPATRYRSLSLTAPAVIVSLPSHGTQYTPFPYVLNSAQLPMGPTSPITNNANMTPSSIADLIMVPRTTRAVSVSNSTPNASTHSLTNSRSGPTTASPLTSTPSLVSNLYRHRQKCCLK